MNVLTIIPAKGNSKRITRKNIRLLCNKPLLGYAIDQARFIPDNNIIVTTEDEEIANVAQSLGAQVIDRDESLANDEVEISEVVADALFQWEESNEKRADIVFVLLPIAPLLSEQTIVGAYQEFCDKDMRALKSCVSISRCQLRQTEETSAFYFFKRRELDYEDSWSEITNVFPVSQEENILIFTREEWFLCQHYLRQKRILIIAEGYREIGLGHIYRSIMLSRELLDHEVMIATTQKSDIGIKKLKQANVIYEVVEKLPDVLKLIEEYSPDIVINDILNTEADFIIEEKKRVKRVVNYEDKGPGSKYADAVINALYGGDDSLVGDQYFWGEKYYCLRDEFRIISPSEFSDKVENVLICFGGTDPSGFNTKILDAIEIVEDDEDIVYQFVLGVGYVITDEFRVRVEASRKRIKYVQDVNSIVQYMNKADLAISSQGRTIYELASQRVPTIVLAQNDREYEHEFAFLKNGFINLGNGNAISAETVAETMQWLIHSQQIRHQMYDEMSRKDLGKGISRVRKIILADI